MYSFFSLSICLKMCFFCHRCDIGPLEIGNTGITYVASGHKSWMMHCSAKIIMP